LRKGRRGTAWTALVLAVALLGPRAGVVGAQMPVPRLESYLRIESAAEPARGGRERITGYVENDRDYWAAGVQLLAEALDLSGQVVGTATASLYGAVPPRNRSYFSIDISPPDASYRVTVRSADWRGYGAGGGG
jgi:hypothetical protein